MLARYDTPNWDPRLLREVPDQEAQQAVHIDDGAQCQDAGPHL